MSASATILGGGVAGLTLAAELQSRGLAVTLIDKHTRPGPEACSWWAGGMLAPFCEAESAEEPVVRLGQEAAGWWERHGVTVTRRGSLVVALSRDRRELDRFARRTKAHRMLDGQEIGECEPQLAGQYDRALLFETEAHLDPRAALGGLRDRLEEKGVRFEEGDELPETDDALRFDCRGLAARDALRDLRGVKGEMAVVHAPEVTLSRPVRLLHPRLPLYVVPREDHHFMIGATQIESADRRRVSVRSVLELLSAAYALHPAFGEAELVELGTDARPAFPDNLPRIRQIGGTTYLNGLFRHGYLLAPALARMAADLVLDDIRPEVMDEDQRQW